MLDEDVSQIIFLSLISSRSGEEEIKPTVVFFFVNIKYLIKSLSHVGEYTVLRVFDSESSHGEKPMWPVKQSQTEATDQHTDNVICSGEHTQSLPENLLCLVSLHE